MEEKTLEEVFSQLDTVIQDMEREDISLEESFRLYHEGMQMLKVCNEKIDTVETVSYTHLTLPTTERV